MRKQADVQSPLAAVVACLEATAGGLPLNEPQQVIEFIKNARLRKPDITASPVVRCPLGSMHVCALQSPGVSPGLIA